MQGIVYHKDYNKYDLGVSHPLVGDKPKRTLDLLKEKNMLKDVKEFTAKKATEQDILRVHSQEYVDRVKALSKTGGMLSSDTPAPIGIFETASIATGGTLLAGEKLFEKYTCMSNPLGGFHHAGRSSSSGFCFFNDIAVVIEYLRKKHKIKRFAVVDLDVHHGNGTQDIYCRDPTVLNLSFHQDGKTLYPGTGAVDFIGKDKGTGYTVNLPLPPGTGTASYLIAFNEIVPTIIEQFKPEIIIYQSGVDTHHTDPLADLYLTYQAYFYLANKMLNLSKKTCNKLLVLFGGGYNSASSLVSYYNIMCGLLQLNHYKEEQDDFSHQKSNIVKNQVLKLKNVLKPHWSL
jgi:acetoin utilization protein AcuC